MKQTAVEWLAEQLIESHYGDVIEQAKEIEAKQKGYSEEDVKKMLYKCCDDLENNKRAFWNINGLVDEIITTFKTK